MKTLSYIALIFLLTLPASISLYAQTVPDMVTDRPDQTESAVVVPLRSLQIETGYTHMDTGNFTTDELPGTLLRYGLHERIELRFAITGWVFDDASDENGFGDSEAGIKVRLYDESGMIPEAALLAGITLPTGEENFTSDEADPRIRLAFAHTLSDRFSLGYNVAAEWNTIADETELAVPYTCGLGIGLDDRFGTYVEFFGEFPEEGDSSHLFNTGVTYSILTNLQADIEGGFGLNDEAPDWFAGAGLSVRIPR